MPRPRTKSLPPNEMILLGEEMIDWVKENKPLHLSQWYSGVKMILFHNWKNYCDTPEFSPYYEKALSLISHNYMDGTINPSIASRFINIYFKDVKRNDMKDMRDKGEFELEMKKRFSDHEAANKAKETNPPFTESVNMENENMRLKDEIKELRALLDNKRQTE